MSLVELFVCLFFSSFSGAKARKNHRYSNNMGIKNRYLIPETIKLVMCCRPHALGSNLALANVNFFPVKLKRDLHFDHRRTGNFLPGVGVNHLPKKNLTSCPLRVEKKRGPYCNIVMPYWHYWHMEVARDSFSWSIPSLRINYVAINKHLEKLPPHLY